MPDCRKRKLTRELRECPPASWGTAHREVYGRGLLTEQCIELVSMIGAVFVNTYFRAIVPIKNYDETN